MRAGHWPPDKVTCALRGEHEGGLPSIGYLFKRQLTFFNFFFLCHVAFISVNLRLLYGCMEWEVGLNPDFAVQFGPEYMEGCYLLIRL